MKVQINVTFKIVFIFRMANGKCTFFFVSSKYFELELEIQYLANFDIIEQAIFFLYSK